MTKKEMSSKDLLLCFLFSPGINESVNEPIVGRTKLTKMMYLFEKQIYGKFFKDEIEIDLPEFEAYYFGPFSKQLFEDLSFFQSIGLVETKVTNIPLSSAEKVEKENVFDVFAVDEEDDEGEEPSFDEEENKELAYTLSENGINFVRDKLWNKFTDKQKDKLKSFKKQINLISLDALLRYVYTTYPDDACNSKIKDKYL